VRAQVNSASYPQPDRKKSSSLRLRGEGLVWISCHFRDCKALLVTSQTHERSAVASTGPLPLPLTFYCNS